MNGNIPWGSHLGALPKQNDTHPSGFGVGRAAPSPRPESPVAANSRRRKVSTTIRLDADVLEWLRQPGPGYQSRISAILRREMLRDRKP